MPSIPDTPSLPNESTTKTDNLDNCSICWEFFLLSKLFAACGNDACPAAMCHECGHEWYAGNRPGEMINERNFNCPFCTRLPTQLALTNYGEDSVKAVIHLSHEFFDPEIVYVWCWKCKEPRPLHERECLPEEFLMFPKWTCIDCDPLKRHEREEAELRWAAQAVEQAEQRGDPAKLVKAQEHELQVFDSIENENLGNKPCPGCGILTQRPFQCGYLHCIVRGCGVDWCYFCGEACDKASIFDHMKKIHQDIFGGLTSDRDFLAAGAYTAIDPETATDPTFEPDTESEEDDDEWDI